MSNRIATAIALFAMLTGPGWSQDAIPADMPDKTTAAWAACLERVETQGENWLGWKRDFGNGYGDSFAFYDGTFDQLPSVLVTTTAIDAIAWEETRWCYRADGSLAVIATSMAAPVLDAAGGEGMDFGKRVGWIAVEAPGTILATQGWVERDGKAIGAVDDPELELARGCEPVALYLRVNDVQLQMEAVLGDIEGNRPELEPPLLYDWCGALAAD